MADDPRAQGVLLITRNLPPLRGGMERLVQQIAVSLATKHRLSVVGPIGCTALLPEDVRTCEIPSGPLIRFLWAATIAVDKLARGGLKISFAGSGLTAPFAWLASRRTGSRFAVYLHGLDIIAPSWLYQRCWLPFIRRADLVLVNSRNTRQLAIDYGVPPGVIQVLHPGTTVPGPDEAARRRFRDALGLDDRPVMLSVGRLTPRKGLVEFVREALPRIRKQYPDVILLIIGEDATDAVRRLPHSETARILQAATDAGVAESVRLCSPCDDTTLSNAYRAADIYVFPVLDIPGDVEGFGMVAIEAAAHGLPTVAFAVGGVPDAVIDDITGSLAAAGDYGDFAAKVIDWLLIRFDAAIREECTAAAARFAWERFSERLLTLIG